MPLRAPEGVARPGEMVLQALRYTFRDPLTLV